MKLLHRITRYYFMLSIVLFVVGSFFAYFILRTLITEEVDETLLSEKYRIIKDLQQKKDPIPEWHSINMEIEPTHETNPQTKILQDTLLFVSDSREWVPLRQLVFSAKIKNNSYRITLRRSLIENDDLVTGVSLLMSGLFLTTILIFNFIIYRGDRRLWKPFYQTLEKLERFDLHKVEAMSLPDEDIAEFAQLNRALNNLTQKIQNDYRNIKEFSENAAHEMQTPLAVIRSKLDVLIQDQKLSAGQMQTIHSLYHAVNRLARLNQSLNLLTKIENREYHEKQSVDFCKLIEQQLQNLNELIQINKIKVISRIGIPFVMEINPFMAETLLSNLLINAVKHNKDQGFIELETTPKSIIITNSGHALKSDPQELFARFKKDNTSADSPGLGLSIVQSICSQNGLNVNYICKDGRHTIKIWKYENRS